MTEYVVGDGDRLVIRATGKGVIQVDLVVELPPPDAPTLPFVDVIAEMPVNPYAQNPPKSPGRWAQRRGEQIRGITVHHTGADDYLALARYCTVNKSLPTTQYTYFVARDGTVYHCVADGEAFWHDHTGYPNFNIAVGIAGYWHQAQPPEALLEGLARIVAWLQARYGIPLAEVQGHDERARRYNYATACPGWNKAGWRSRFFEVLGAL